VSGSRRRKFAEPVLLGLATARNATRIIVIELLRIFANLAIASESA
jgi:hypothetical protein